jgi:hypothetical protein
MSLFRVKIQIPDPSGALVFFRDVEAEDRADAAERGWCQLVADPSVPTLTEDTVAHIYGHPDLAVHVLMVLNNDPDALPSRLKEKPAAPKGEDIESWLYRLTGQGLGGPDAR